MRRLVTVLVLLVLCLAGCSGGRTQAPTQPAQEPEPAQTSSSSPGQPPPPLPVRECSEEPQVLKLYGIELGAPAAELMSQLGTPSKITRNGQNYLVMYEFPHVLVIVREDTGTLYLLEVSDGAVRGEVLPGISIGAPKESVLKGLDNLGLCVRDPNTSEWGLFGSDHRLRFEFRENKLSRVRLEYNGV